MCYSLSPRYFPALHFKRRNDCSPSSCTRRSLLGAYQLIISLVRYQNMFEMVEPKNKSLHPCSIWIGVPPPDWTGNKEFLDTHLWHFTTQNPWGQLKLNNWFGSCNSSSTVQQWLGSNLAHPLRPCKQRLIFYISEFHKGFIHSTLNNATTALSLRNLHNKTNSWK